MAPCSWKIDEEKTGDLPEVIGTICETVIKT
jgi:hypothetical protein